MLSRLLFELAQLHICPNVYFWGRATATNAPGSPPLVVPLRSSLRYIPPTQETLQWPLIPRLLLRFSSVCFPTTHAVPPPLPCLNSKHADAMKPLREAVAVLDEAIAGVSANEGGAANRFEFPVQNSREGFALWSINAP